MLRSYLPPSLSVFVSLFSIRCLKNYSIPLLASAGKTIITYVNFTGWMHYRIYIYILVLSYNYVKPEINLGYMTLY